MNRGAEYENFMSQLREIESLLEQILNELKEQIGSRGSAMIKECNHEWEGVLIPQRFCVDGVWVCKKCGLEKRIENGVTTYRKSEANNEI